MQRATLFESAETIENGLPWFLVFPDDAFEAAAGHHESIDHGHYFDAAHCVSRKRREAACHCASTVDALQGSRVLGDLKVHRQDS